LRKIQIDKSRAFARLLFTFFVLVLFDFGGLYLLKNAYQEKHEKLNLLLFLAILGISLSIYSVFYLIKKHLRQIPFISFDSSLIWINKVSHRLDGISDIQLSGKFKYEKVSRSANETSAFREGMKFKTPDGKMVVLFDEFYKNLSDLKIKLNNGSMELNQNLNFRNKSKEVYRSSQFKKTRGYLLWGLTIYLLTMTKNVDVYGQSLIILIVTSIFFYHSNLMNFFILSNKTISIKKENIFWFKNTFELEDIYEIVLDFYTTPPDHRKKIKQVRIVLNNFEQKTYPASLLTNRNWQDLEKELLDRGIKVRDERNIDYT